MSSRVLIAGGGVAALEAAIALQDLAGDRAEVQMCSPREDFIYRPFAVAEPYGASRPMRYDLAELAERCGASYDRATIGSIDGEAKRAHTHDGEEIAYDHLIRAFGTRLLAGVSGAVTFWGVADDGRVVDVVRDLRERKVRRVAFTMPGGGTWALLLYERGIEVVTGVVPINFEEGRLSLSPRATVEADAVLSLPRMEGRRIGGVPHDLAGFVPVDDHGRVRGMQSVYAAGDVTSFPVKQGGIATQQADAAAEAIAAELGCDVATEPFDPILRGVLWTGAEPLYLSGYLAGGHGETSSASHEPAWDGAAEGKIVSRYLTPFLGQTNRSAA